MRLSRKWVANNNNKVKVQRTDHFEIWFGPIVLTYLRATMDTKGRLENPDLVYLSLFSLLLFFSIFQVERVWRANLSDSLGQWIRMEQPGRVRRWKGRFPIKYDSLSRFFMRVKSVRRILRIWRTIVYKSEIVEKSNVRFLFSCI